MPLAQHLMPLAQHQSHYYLCASVSEVPLCEEKNDHLSPLTVYIPKPVEKSYTISSSSVRRPATLSGSPSCRWQ